MSLGMSKIQKRFIFRQILRVMEIYWTLCNIPWIQSTDDCRQRLKLFPKLKNLQITEQLFIYRIINKHENQR